MVVHDEGESDASLMPCKDSTLVVRQVQADKTEAVKKMNRHQSFLCCLFDSSTPQYFFILFICCDDRLLLLNPLPPKESSSATHSAGA